MDVVPEKDEGRWMRNFHLKRRSYTGNPLQGLISCSKEKEPKRNKGRGKDDKKAPQKRA